MLNTKEHLPDIICFHCQQCAEKYLKAYLAYQNIFFPKTHILGNLLRLCITANAQFDTIEASLRTLDDYSVAPRYPDE